MEQQPSKGWVLYDGTCGFCSRLVPAWEQTLARYGFAIAPLQEDWVASKVGIPSERLLDDIRVLLVSGEVYSGADAYRHVLSHIVWAKPLVLLSRLPILCSLVDRGYRFIARNRYCILKSP